MGVRSGRGAGQGAGAGAGANVFMCVRVGRAGCGCGAPELAGAGGALLGLGHIGGAAGGEVTHGVIYRADGDAVGMPQEQQPARARVTDRRARAGLPIMYCKACIANRALPRMYRRSCIANRNDGLDIVFGQSWIAASTCHSCARRRLVSNRVLPIVLCKR